MKKYLFIAVFGLMFVPVLASANVNVNQLWQKLVQLLQMENQLLKERVAQLEEMNKRLASNSCPSVSSVNSGKELAEKKIKEQIAELQLEQRLSDLDQKYGINHLTVTRNKIREQLQAEIAKLMLYLARL